MSSNPRDLCTNKLTKSQIEILQTQTIDQGNPGPFLRDVQTLVDAIGDGMLTSSEYFVLPQGRLVELNWQLSEPLVHRLKRPQLRSFPTLMGYSSRILAESWESSNIYFASLADELGMKPSELNIQVPLWTKLAVEKIFATHLEDWPALLRSLRLVGQEMRQSTKPTQQGSF